MTQMQVLVLLRHQHLLLLPPLPLLPHNPLCQPCMVLFALLPLIVCSQKHANRHQPLKSSVQTAFVDSILRASGSEVAAFHTASAGF